MKQFLFLQQTLVSVFLLCLATAQAAASFQPLTSIVAFSTQKGIKPPFHNTTASATNTGFYFEVRTTARCDSDDSCMTPSDKPLQKTLFYPLSDGELRLNSEEGQRVYIDPDSGHMRFETEGTPAKKGAYIVGWRFNKTAGSLEFKSGSYHAKSYACPGPGMPLFKVKFPVPGNPVSSEDCFRALLVPTDVYAAGRYI